jgi:hypothetical protein
MPDPQIRMPTAGFVSPQAINGELEDTFVRRFLNVLVSGIVTTIDPKNVRPRWQPEPGNEPAFTTDWCGVGIVRRTRDVFAAELLNFNPPTNPAGSTRTVLATDDFHRPDEEPLDPAKWNVLAGLDDLAVVSDQCAGPAALDPGAELYIAVASPPDQYCAITLGAVNQNCYLYLRAKNGSQGYVCAVAAGLGILSIGTLPITSFLVNVLLPSVQTGDKIIFGVAGKTLFAYYNGALVATVDDTTLTSGLTGCGIADAAHVSTISLFETGQLTQLEGGFTRVVRNEILEVIASFYGPNSDANAELFAMGMSLAQNREALLLNGFGLVEVEDSRTVPALMKERWLAGVDVPFRMRRQQIYDYPTAVLVAANGTLTLDDGEVIQIIAHA